MEVGTHPALQRHQGTAERQTLADRAYQQLESMIVTLQLQPGSVVTEGELGALLGIGRTPLREAIQRLAAQRLVSTLPRRGLMISEINLTDHLGVLETRRALDRLIASSAARRAKPDERGKLKEYAHQMERAAATEDLAEFMRLDRDIDSLMAEASHNAAASHALGPLHTHCRRFWYLYRHQGDLPKAAELHEALIIAVVAENEEAAASASDALLGYLEQFTRSALDVYWAR
jgi:DNA-binding GntR family transcriptional regulator